MSVGFVKKTIDTLINARWVVPIIPENTVLDHCSIAIDKGVIVDVLPTNVSSLLQP
mgnify:CR=1 FL=1